MPDQNRPHQAQPLDERAGAMRAPASVEKLYTTVALMSVLGPDAREGALDDGATPTPDGRDGVRAQPPLGNLPRGSAVTVSEIDE